jgi:hypothetical protein
MVLAQVSDGFSLVATMYNKGAFGGDGSLGALSQGAGSFIITPGSWYNYSSINIQATGSLCPSGLGAVGSPLLLKCQGTCTIAGHIDLFGRGYPGTAGLNSAVLGTPGGNGIGGDSTTGGAAGAAGILYPHGLINSELGNVILVAPGTGGGTGGTTTAAAGGGGGGGGGGASYSANGTAGTGGSNGTGGSGTEGAGGTGGAGGGAIYIEVGSNLAFTGSIIATGSAGGAGTASTGNTGGSGGGGGGGGGNVWISANGTIVNTGYTSVTAGAGGAAGGETGTGGAGGAGGAGGTGTVKIIAKNRY